MGRQVKLWDKPGEKGDSTVSYKAPNGKYYSSESAYQQIMAQKEYRKKCLDYLCNILDYDDDIPFPTIMPKLLDEMKKCGYDVLFETIQRHENNIVWALQNKDFSNEYQKIKYIMTIVRNNVIDVYREYQQKVAADRTKAEIINIDDFKQQHKQKKTDISRWLDD